MTQIRPVKRRNGPSKYQKYEARKLKRRQIEQSYREHTPPQIRHGRFLARVKRVNERPSNYPSMLPSQVCPEGCGKFFHPKHLLAHVRKRHNA